PWPAATLRRCDRGGLRSRFRRLRRRIGRPKRDQSGCWQPMSRKREPFLPPGAIPVVSTDSEIIQRSLAEPGAFSEIFERHVRPVGGYIRRRVGVDAVDDVLSETFLVAFRRRASFDGAWESARPWLLGIATRVVKRHRADEARQWRSFEASAAGEVE